MDIDMLDQTCSYCGKNGTSACEYDCPLMARKPKHESEISFRQETETAYSHNTESEENLV